MTLLKLTTSVYQNDAIIFSIFFSDPAPMTKESSHKKTWKGKVAKQWKRMQASGSSTAQNNSYPEGGSIGNILGFWNGAEGAKRWERSKESYARKL